MSELTDSEKESLGLDFGLRIDAITGPVAERAGLRAGDIILSLDNRDLDSLEGFAVLAAQLPADRPLPLLVERDGQQSFFTLRLEG